jgi:ABC-type transport system involved in multi-copper enzyme maturation permease subunit
MTKNRFLMNLTWELKNLFRFPFPEIILALFTYMVFLPRMGGYSSSFGLENLVWRRITWLLAFVSTQRGAFYSVSAYLPMAILASIFATLAFAYEIENGLMKVHLSHPTSRRAIFLSKFLSCFLIVFTTLSCSLLFFAFLDIPENALHLIINSHLTLGVLLVAALETFFIVTLTVSFSIFSKKASVSLVGSFAAVYIIQLLSETANLTFLPPTSFYGQVYFLFSRSGPKLSGLPDFLVIPFVSTFLAIISYVYFSRRLELT